MILLSCSRPRPSSHDPGSVLKRRWPIRCRRRLVESGYFLHGKLVKQHDCESSDYPPLIGLCQAPEEGDGERAHEENASGAPMSSAEKGTSQFTVAHASVQTVDKPQVTEQFFPIGSHGWQLLLMPSIMWLANVALEFFRRVGFQVNPGQLTAPSSPIHDPLALGSPGDGRPGLQLVWKTSICQAS